MKNLNKKLGVGGECSCIADALHPSALIREKYGTNGYKERRINNLLVLRLEDRIICRRNVLSLVLCHDDFPNIELYAAAAKVKLEIPGPSESYFIQNNNNSQPIVNPNNEAEAVEVVENENHSLLRNGVVDIPWLIAEGYEVDDNNAPNIENIPTDGPPPVIEWNNWGWQGVDLRNENDQQRNHGARVPTSEFLQEFSLFWKFFPQEVYRRGSNTRNQQAIDERPDDRRVHSLAWSYLFDGYCYWLRTT